MLNLKTILCPVDFSEPSSEGLRYAVELARQFGSELLVVHVVPPIDNYPGLFLSTDQIEKAVMDNAATQLSEFVLDNVSPSINVRTALRYGSAADGIVDAAQAESVDLIVISTHGRTGLQHFLMGSVAERVLRHAQCPVLTVRKKAVAKMH